MNAATSQRKCQVRIKYSGAACVNKAAVQVFGRSFASRSKQMIVQVNRRVDRLLKQTFDGPSPNFITRINFECQLRSYASQCGELDLMRLNFRRTIAASP